MSTKHQELTFIGLTNRYNHKIKGLENCLQLLRFLCPLQLFPQHKKKNEVHNVWKLQKKSHSILWAKRATFYTLSGQKFIENAKKWCILISKLGKMRLWRVDLTQTAMKLQFHHWHWIRSSMYSWRRSLGTVCIHPQLHHDFWRFSMRYHHRSNPRAHPLLWRAFLKFTYPPWTCMKRSITRCHKNTHEILIC